MVVNTWLTFNLFIIKLTIVFTLWSFWVSHFSIAELKDISIYLYDFVRLVLSASLGLIKAAYWWPGWQTRVTSGSYFQRCNSSLQMRVTELSSGGRNNTEKRASRNWKVMRLLIKGFLKTSCNSHTQPYAPGHQSIEQSVWTLQKQRMRWDCSTQRRINLWISVWRITCDLQSPRFLCTNEKD